MTLANMDKRLFPRHVAIIMDGNGRWAKQRHLPTLLGHRAGSDNLDRVVKLLADYGIKYLTLYMFSTENWNRPKMEVSGLLNLLARRIDRETKFFHKANIRLKHLGRLDRLSPKLKGKVEAAIELTKDNSGMTLCLAFDYGSRDEIVEAARRLVSQGIPPANIDETLLSQYLYSSDVPDPDLIIRTGGEMRLSNFLLWQAAYSELYFTPVLWPDFGPKEIEKAFLDYEQRQRHFGGR
jgi:undecaprenyl diphosphate synthase